MSEKITNKPYNPKEYDDFIEDWKNKRKEYEENGSHFCIDGVINDDAWNKSQSKIMFLLKESYGKFYDIRNNEYLSALHMPKDKPQAKIFFQKMRMCTYIIDNRDKIINGNTPPFPDAEELDKLNDSIAYVNLKKRVEIGRTKSNYYDIRNYVWDDNNFLLKQIDLINPRIIVCSGTFNYCRDYLYGNFKNTAHKKLYKMENRYFIDFWHLSYWIKSPKDFYNHLLDIVKHIK